MCNIEDIVKCQVTGVNSYGIFVKYNDEYSGLIHISEVSDGFVKDIDQFAKEGDFIFCRIIDIDKENKHLKLSIKHIDYKNDGKLIGALESKRGFKPLKEQLPIWTAEKIDEFKTEEQQ